MCRTFFSLASCASNMRADRLTSLCREPGADAAVSERDTMLALDDTLTAHSGLKASDVALMDDPRDW